MSSDAGLPDPHDPVRLCQTVSMLRHLAVNLPEPLRLCLLAPAEPGAPVASAESLQATQRAVGVALARIGVDAVRFLHNGETQLSSFEMFISKKICASLDFAYDRFDSVERLERFERFSQGFDFSGTTPQIETQSLTTWDGTPLTVYASAGRHLPAVVLVLPCGMPFDLCRDWFVALSAHYFVLTWETRGLFGDCAAFDQIALDTPAQVGDLIAVMQAFEVADAHWMGICGGAVIALCAAAAHGERVSSLSLWHGDYNLGDNGLRTRHQQNFQWLMETAAQDRAEARDLQAMFIDQATLATTPEAIAHVALLPYVNPELFYRYARVNDALNNTELLPLLQRIDVPTLVVAGDNDQTTHICGSRLIAQTIPGARLHIEQGGSHLAFFESPAPSRATARAFIDATLEHA